MPTTSEKNEKKALGEILALGRKTSLNFAALLAKGNGVVLRADRRKPIGNMRKLAKADGGGPQGAWGTLTVTGKLVQLHCDEPPPKTMEKLLKKQFADNGHSVQVRVELPSDKSPGLDEAPIVFPDDANAKDDMDATTTDITDLIAKARKKPHSFAWVRGKEGMILRAHKLKSSEMMLRAAKANGGSLKGAWGRLHVEGKTLVLNCENDPPNSFLKEGRVYLRDHGQTLKLILRTPEGEMVDEGTEVEKSELAGFSDAAGPAFEPQSTIEASNISQKLTALRELAKRETGRQAQQATLLADRLAKAENAGNAGAVRNLLIVIDTRFPDIAAPTHQASPPNDPERDGPEGGNPKSIDLGDETLNPKAKQQYGNFFVKLEKNKKIDSKELFETAYSQYLGRIRGSNPSPEEARVFSAENGLGDKIVWPSDRKPMDLIPDKYAGDTERQNSVTAWLETGGVWLQIVPVATSEFSKDEAQSIDEKIANLPSEDLDELNNIADKIFAGATGHDPSYKIPGPDHPEAQMWHDQRKQALILYDKFKNLPPHIAEFFEEDDSGLPLTSENLQKALNFAEKLQKLTPAELARIAPSGRIEGLKTYEISGLTLATEMVEDIIETRMLVENSAAGPITWIKSGDFYQSFIGKFQAESFRGGERTSRGLDTKEMAIGLARRAGTAAAVIIEDGGIVVYKIELKAPADDNSKMPRLATKMDVSSVAMPNPHKLPTETRITEVVKRCLAIVTDDGVVVTLHGGVGVLQTGGLGGDPISAPIESFGLGLKKLKDSETFGPQFDNIMKDMAFDAVNEAQDFADEWKARLESKGFTSAELAAMERALAAMDQCDVDIGEIEARIDPVLEEISQKEAELNKEYPSQPGDYEDPDVQADYQSRREEIDNLMASISSEIEEVNALKKQKTTTAVKDFPLVAKLTTVKDRADFRKLEYPQQQAILMKAVSKAYEAIATARAHLMEPDFNPLTIPQLGSRTMDDLALEEPQRGWAQERIKQARDKDSKDKIVSAVVSIGLGTAAGLLSGPAGAVAAIGALSMGVSDAIDATDEYAFGHAATDMVVDPNGKRLLPPGAAPHWAGVALAWGGVVLDGVDVATAIPKAIKAIESVGIVDNLLDLSKADLAQRFKKADLGLDPAQLSKFTDEAFDILQSGKIARISPQPPLSDKVYDSLFGAYDTEATTLIKENADGSLSLDVFFRKGASPTERQSALAEEMIHAKQLAEPGWAKDFKNLTEDALHNWDAKAVEEKLLAYRSRLALEIDAQKRRAAEAVDLQESGKLSGSELKDVLEDIEASLEMYAKQFDEIEAGIRTKTAPDWLADAPPPRLHQTPVNPTRIQQRAIDDLSGNVIKEPNPFPPEGMAFYLMPNGNYNLRAKPGFDTTGDDFIHWRLKKVGDKYELVEGNARQTDLDRFEALKKEFADPTGFEEFEELIARKDINPECVFYLRKYAKTFDMLEAKGIDPETILSRLTATSYSGFEKELRRVVRETAIKHIYQNVPVENRWGAFMDVLDMMPDNGARGALFGEFRKKNMPKYLKDLDDAPRTLEGTNRQLDGVTKIDDARKGPGPTKPGAYGVEDKVTSDAFKESQARTYIAAFLDGLKKSGKPSMITQNAAQSSVLSGLNYLCPTLKDAIEIEKKLKKIFKNAPDGIDPKLYESIKSQFHIGYFLDGVLVWRNAL